MSFYIIVASIAVITLIILLTWIGYGMQNHINNVQFPPVSSACPDFWTIKGDDENPECINDRHLGSCNNTPSNETMYFNTSFFQGDQGFCRKADWARRCQVSWNGFTNAGAQLQKQCGQQ